MTLRKMMVGREGSILDNIEDSTKTEK